MRRQTFETWGIAAQRKIETMDSLESRDGGVGHDRPILSWTCPVNHVCDFGPL